MSKFVAGATVSELVAGATVSELVAGATVSELVAETVLAEPDWTARAEAHRTRATRMLDRYNSAQPHPVWDFLFTYYSVRPRQLLRWHPGYGGVLTGPAAHDYLGRTGYAAHPAGIAVGADYLAGRIETVRFVADLLSSTAARPAQLNCFGLHEWAMVYRSADVRHDAVPLRLGAAGTNAVVDSMPLRCSHFDAYRFFTSEAVQRNSTALTRVTQSAREQPGCVHANMDLYKWCGKLSPLIDSDLLLDCLELAAAARELDMRASPYDLAGYGFDPIRIEHPAGRAEYVRLQSTIAAQATPLRLALLSRCEQLLGLAHPAAVGVAKTG